MEVTADCEIIEGFRLKLEFPVKKGTWFYLTVFLWSLKPEGGAWYAHSLTHGLRIPLTLIAIAIDILKGVLFAAITIGYKAIKYLIKWLLGLIKDLIKQAFKTVSAKFFGTLLIIAALFLAYTFFADAELWREWRDTIQDWWRIMP